MIEANDFQIMKFKKKYCLNDESRQKMLEDFDIEVESFEDLLPNKTVQSYATGSREINKSFIMLKAYDKTSTIVYYPVFSESLGRQLINQGNLKLPNKMSIFKSISERGDKSTNEKINTQHSENKTKRKEENKKMLQLIIAARHMMILHIKDPKPMVSPFRDIYRKLENHPYYDVFASDIKSINTAIGNFLKKDINTKNENFENLQQFITYLKNQNIALKDLNFKILSDKMKAKYPNEKILF